jgi:hypothetical protein
MTDWQVARIEEIPRTGGSKRWIPIRKHFGIRAFGINGWFGENEGDEIISEHDEDADEELYFVSSGRATFTVGGEEIDAPTGTLVFVQPQAKRKAVAREASTTIVAAGATPGDAFEVSAWEANGEMFPLYEAGDYEGAAAVVRAALERQPDPGLYYNLACMEALQGHADEALGALEHVGNEERFRELAASDSDLDSLRDDPRFAELLSPKS